MALVTDLISVWLRYEVKYNMLLRLKEYTNNINNKSSFQLYSKGGW